MSTDHRNVEDPGDRLEDSPPRYWLVRQNGFRTQLRLARSLRAASRLAPSLRNAGTIQSLLSQIRRECMTERDIVNRCDDALAPIAVYIREAHRESWRKPPPGYFHAAAEKALVVADLVGPRAVEGLDEPPPSPEDVEAIIQAWDITVDDEDQAYDNPYAWRDCYRGTIFLRHSDVAPAVVVRCLEKALGEAELEDAHVTPEDEVVAVYWVPDEDEDWEKDLLLATLETAAEAAGLPATSARVRWRRA